MEARTLPDPVASIAGKVGGVISLETFKQQEGIALLPAKMNKYCKVTSFTMALVLPEQDPVEVSVEGAAFSQSAKLHPSLSTFSSFRHRAARVAPSLHSDKASFRSVATYA